MHFLERLQHADDRTKTRWVIGISTVLMAAVIVVWLVYFNNFVTGFGRQETPTPGGEDRSFTGTMRRGAAVVWETLRGFIEQLQQPRRFEVTPAP